MERGLQFSCASDPSPMEKKKKGVAIPYYLQTAWMKKLANFYNRLCTWYKALGTS